MISAAGQTINLPGGHFATLNFLAAGVNGNQANLTFTVTYTDGTIQTFTQSVSDLVYAATYSDIMIDGTTFLTQIPKN